MITNDQPFAQLRFDVDLEMLLVVAFSWGAAASLGLISDNILPFIDACATIWEVGNATFRIGRIVSIASLLLVFFYRDAPLSDTSGIDLWIDVDGLAHLAGDRRPDQGCARPSPDTRRQAPDPIRTGEVGCSCSRAPRRTRPDPSRRRCALR